jgi:hypothetical protein
LGQKRTSSMLACLTDSRHMELGCHLVLISEAVTRLPLGETCRTQSKNSKN